MTDALERFLARAELFMQRVEASLPHTLSAPDWNASIAFRYRRRTSGQGVISPVTHIGAMSLDALREIETQKEKIYRNTAQFVRGGTANNVLLTGARGTGKSSLIRACLHAFASQGLRLIEVDKADLIDLQEIIELIAARPEKFIVFCDDLSFDDGELGYKALKSVLDGSVAATTPNVLIYATAIAATCYLNTCQRTAPTSIRKMARYIPARVLKRRFHSLSGSVCGLVSIHSVRTSILRSWHSGYPTWASHPSKLVTRVLRRCYGPWREVPVAAGWHFSLHVILQAG